MRTPARARRAGVLPFAESKRVSPMNVGDERSRSLWMDVDVAPNAARLTREISCDTVIVGSGIAGLSTAYELSGQGQMVIPIKTRSMSTNTAVSR